MKYEKEVSFKLMIKNFLEERYLLKYPLLISYERSGAHWMNYVMELYFNRPRLRRGTTALDKNRKDYMWMHDHDRDLKLLNKIMKLKNYRFEKILYLYRNPLDVLESYIEFRKVYYGNEVNFDEELEKIKNHQREYLICSFVVPIKYENFKDKNKRVGEFRKICDFFNKPFDKERIERIFTEVEGVILSHKEGD